MKASGKPVGRLRRAGLALSAALPPRVRKYLIAQRNWRRGEPEIRLLRQLVDPHRAAVDVGAHMGAYTFFLSRLCRRVHAFEPLAECAAFLRAAYGPHVEVHACALSDHSGQARLLTGGAGVAQTARLGEAGAGEPAVTVEVRRLDEFELGEVGFVKIDAEGAECAVLRGAAGLLARCRPVLLVEIEERHVGERFAGELAFVESLGYRGSFLLEGALQPLARFDLETLQRARLRGDRSRPYINNFVFEPLPR